MSRKVKKVKLTTSINIPLTPDQKKKLEKKASEFPGNPSPTAYGRMVLVEKIDREEPAIAAAR